RRTASGHDRRSGRRRSAGNAPPRTTHDEAQHPPGAEETMMTATQIAPRYMARPAAQLDRLVLGDNQFFGVNHMSEEKARAQAMRVQEVRALMEGIGAAYDEGIRPFMCTTHDRIAEVVEVVKADPSRYAGFTFYPG